MKKIFVALIVFLSVIAMASVVLGLSSGSDWRMFGYGISQPQDRNDASIQGVLNYTAYIESPYTMSQQPLVYDFNNDGLDEIYVQDSNFQFIYDKDFNVLAQIINKGYVGQPTTSLSLCNGKHTIVTHNVSTLVRFRYDNGTLSKVASFDTGRNLSTQGIACYNIFSDDYCFVVYKGGFAYFQLLDGNCSFHLGVTLYPQKYLNKTPIQTPSFGDVNNDGVMDMTLWRNSTGASWAIYDTVFRTLLYNKSVTSAVTKQVPLIFSFGSGFKKIWYITGTSSSSSMNCVDVLGNNCAGYPHTACTASTSSFPSFSGSTTNMVQTLMHGKTYLCYECYNHEHDTSGGYGNSKGGISCYNITGFSAKESFVNSCSWPIPPPSESSDCSRWSGANSMTSSPFTQFNYGDNWNDFLLAYPVGLKIIDTKNDSFRKILDASNNYYWGIPVMLDLDGYLDIIANSASGIKTFQSGLAAPPSANNVTLAFYDNEQYLLHGTFVPLQNAKVCLDSMCQFTSIVGKTTFTGIVSLSGHSLNVSLSGYNNWADTGLSLFALPSENVYWGTKLPALYKSASFYPDLNYLLNWEDKFNENDNALSHYGWYSTVYNSFLKTKNYSTFGAVFGLNSSISFNGLKHPLYYISNDNWFSGNMILNNINCAPLHDNCAQNQTIIASFTFFSSNNTELFSIAVGRRTNDSEVIGQYYNYTSGKYETCFTGVNVAAYPFDFAVKMDNYAGSYFLEMNDYYTQALTSCPTIHFKNGVSHLKPAYVSIGYNQLLTSGDIYLDNLRASDYIGLGLPNTSLTFNTMLSVFDYSSNAMLSGAAFSFSDLSGNVKASGVTDDTGIGYVNISMGQFYCLNISKSGYNIYRDCAVNASFNFYTIQSGNLFAKNAYMRATTQSCDNGYMINWADDFGYVFVPEDFGWNSGGLYNSGYYTTDFGTLGKMLRFDGLGNAITHNLYLSTTNNRITFEVLMKAYVTTAADSNILSAYILNSAGQQSIALRFYTADQGSTEITHFQYWNGVTSQWVEIAQASSASPVGVRIINNNGLVNIDLDLTFSGTYTTYATAIPVLNSGSMSTIMFLPQYNSNPNNDLFIDNVVSSDVDTNCAGQYGGTGGMNPDGSYSVGTVCSQWVQDPVTTEWHYDKTRCNGVGLFTGLFNWSMGTVTTWILANIVYFIILILLIVLLAPLILKGLEIMRGR